MVRVKERWMKLSLGMLQLLEKEELLLLDVLGLVDLLLLHD